MIEEQKIIKVEKAALIAKVTEMRDSGYRLADIRCTAPGVFEIDYSFGKDYEFVSLRLTLPREAAGIPSISAVYPNAFIYENELHDLFGVNVTDITIDYGGNFYRTALKTPFREPAAKTEEEKNG